MNVRIGITESIVDFSDETNYLQTSIIIIHAGLVLFDIDTFLQGKVYIYTAWQDFPKAVLKKRPILRDHCK